jgi:hypothetical protein
MKYTGIISIILGLITNLIIFNSTLGSFDLIPVLSTSIIGVVIAIVSLTKFKQYNKKAVSIIGLIISAIPLLYFGLLCLAFG